MIQISHEMPICLMQNGMEKKYNSYSYALIHLFDEYPVYYKYFVNALREDRFVILDNSIFELGKAFDMKVFAEKVQKLVKDAGDKSNSLMYIIPDVLDSRSGTINNLHKFQKDYPDLPGQSMAVAQGETMADLIQCFAQIRGKVDRIGVSFNCAAYEHHFETLGVFDPKNATELERLEVWKHGRQLFMETLYHLGYLKDTEVHLLGCSLPNEFAYYTTEHKEIGRSIKSLDTSNPVIHGLLGVRYSSEFGLDQKKSIKLADMINIAMSDIEIKKLQLIMYNLDTFRTLNKLPRPIPGVSQA
jgi:hypothetical protein